MLSLRTWILGVKSLLLHPMRSGLTILGIFCLLYTSDAADE